MNVRVLSLLLFFTVLFISTDGRPPKCCVAVSKRVRPDILRSVLSYEVQRSSGLCDINAIIIHTQKIKRICVHPKMKRRIDRMLKKKLLKERMLSSFKLPAP
ncbi:hypothetical protein ACEWY4_012690 [Coilia grayii]|uniref:Chemokine interleukin-8-like domain-containing protein n=1 Tax=Coilia grayii TaxID=363190 RepID=A0ABD1K197_9TELE